MASINKTASLKIKMANLFQVLIDRELFDEDEGELEVIETVENEIRQFAVLRLEQLLGMRDTNGPINIESGSNPFTEEEVAILKVLANSATTMARRQRQSEVSTPSPLPTVPVPPQKRRGRRAKADQAEIVAAKPAPVASTSNTEINDILNNTKYQTTGPKKPAPMPSQEWVDMQNAEQANRNASNSDINSVSDINSILNLIK